MSASLRRRIEKIERNKSSGVSYIELNDDETGKEAVARYRQHNQTDAEWKIIPLDKSDWAA